MKVILSVGIILILAISNVLAQNYALKFEPPLGFRATKLLESDHIYTTDGMDMNGDGLLEITVESDDSLLVFNGSSYQLEWQFTKPFGTYATFYGFYDIDADGVREAIFITNDPTRKIHFINPQTNSIELTLESLTEEVKISNILDLNNDGFYELIVSFKDINTYEITRIQIWGSSTTGITTNPTSSPRYYELSQNYPNPFNPSTNIEYTVQKEGNVQIKIFNSLGQRVRTLVNELMPSGEYSITWNGIDELGNDIASGTYFYQLQVADFISTKKMLIIK